MDKKKLIPVPPAHEQSLRRFKAGVFQVLGHPTRIHVVECLRNGELPVQALVRRIAVEPANLSQHLALLRAKGLVDTRREGNQIFYSLHDPLLVDVLDIMRKYFLKHLKESTTLLQQL
jgi:ArsR family transcriptional regulator